jgi:4-diphosphocytidyl-2-C-methyl-D-erythritol kinase
VEIARLSGAGPTCFAIFADPATAMSAATELSTAYPNWWVKQALIG